MKKFMKVVITLLAIAAIAVPAMAEDRLTLSGGFDTFFINQRVGSDYEYTVHDQRFRLGGKIAVSDAVSVTFRTDINEQDMGASASGETASDWDLAFMTVALEQATIVAGTQYVAYGQNFNTKNSGVKVSANIDPVMVDAFYFVENNQGTIGSTGLTENSDDAYVMGLAATHKNDMYSATLFYGSQNNLTVASEAVSMFGLVFDYNLDAVKLNGEINMFTGDANDDLSQKAVGTQLRVGADMGMFGADFFYSMASDKADETVYTQLGNDFGVGDFAGLGLGFDLEDMSGGRTYSYFTNPNAGVMAITADAKMDVSDDLKAMGKVGYIMTNDTDIEDDNMMFVAAGCAYALADAASLQAEVQYADQDSSADPAISVATGIFVKF